MKYGGSFVEFRSFAPRRVTVIERRAAGMKRYETSLWIATALMTGCQAPNNWERADITKPQSPYTKRRFYRTLLEKVFYDKGVSLPTDDRPIWGTKSSDFANFSKYATQVMRNLGIIDTISADDLRDYEHRYKGHERRIAILWTLSVLCCKVVESVIALDRYWFLAERGIPSVDILPMFDYKVSPRNLVVVAAKSCK